MKRSRRRPYVRTETHDALHPETGLKTCDCGTRFKPRPENGEDDPEKCLACNRKGWSVLFGYDPDEVKETEAPAPAGTVEFPNRRAASGR